MDKNTTYRELAARKKPSKCFCFGCPGKPFIQHAVDGYWLCWHCYQVATGRRKPDPTRFTAEEA